MEQLEARHLLAADLSVDDTYTTEGNLLFVNVTMPTPSSETVYVDYQTANTTAENGYDYQGSGGTLEFAPGEETKTIFITTIDDEFFESDETFVTNIYNPVNATISDSQGVATIYDNETIDLDIDSDNNEGLDEPLARTQHEDTIEDDPAQPGKIVRLNLGDLDNDGVGDWQDGYNQDGVIVSADDINIELLFTPLMFEVADGVDLSAASTVRFRFTYNESDPALADANGPADGAMRIWKKDGFELRTINDDYLDPSGQVYAPSDLGLDDNNRIVTFYVEKLQEVDSTNDRIVVERGTGDYQSFQYSESDAVRIGNPSDGNSTNADSECGCEARASIYTRPINVEIQTGNVIFRHDWGSDVFLWASPQPTYRQTSAANPIVQRDYALAMGAEKLKASLTLNGVTNASAVFYDVSGLDAGDEMVIAIQADTIDLDVVETGHYDYSIDFTFYGVGDVEIGTDKMLGGYDLINRSASPFGVGFWVDGLDHLVIYEGKGVLVVRGDATAGWFAEDGNGDYVTPEGSFSVLSKNGNEFTLTHPNQTKDHFDDEGLLDYREDRNGNRIDFSYTGEGALTSIRNVFGRVTEYDLGGGSNTVTDFAGRVTTYTLDGGGYVVQIAKPDPDDQVSGDIPVTDLAWYTDAADEGTKAFGKLREVQLPESVQSVRNTTTATYDAAGRFSTANSADGTDWDLVASQVSGLVGASSLGSPASIKAIDDIKSTYTDERDKVREFQVDSFGYITSATDPLNHVTEFDRDENGLITEKTEPAGAGGVANLPELVTKYEYDDAGNRTKVIYAQETLNLYDGDAKITESWTYDVAFNQMLSHTDGRGFVTTYVLDSLGNATQINQPESIVTTFTYTAAPNYDPQGASDDLPGGLVLTERDGRGVLTEYVYFDRSGTHGTDPTDDNHHGLLEQVTSGKVDGQSSMAIFTLDTDDESVRQFEYDATLNRTAVIQKMDAPTADRRTDYEYDNLNRLVKITEAAGDHIDAAGNLETSVRPVATYEYDKENFQVKTTDALGRVTESVPDEMFRLQKQILPEAPQFTTGGIVNGKPEFEYFYDAAGNLTGVDDPLDRRTSHTYNDRNELVTTTLPDPDPNDPNDHGPSVTTYAYDAVGNLMSVQDALHESGVTDREITYEYDALHRMTREIYAAPGLHPFDSSTHAAPEIEYVYDDASNQIKVIDPRDLETLYEYDGLNRLTQITRPEPEPQAGQPTTIYEYDEASNRTLVKDAENGDDDLTYAYDALNRLTKLTTLATTQHGAAETTYQYNDAGQQTTITETTPTGTRDTSLQYDDLGRLTDKYLPSAQHEDPLTGESYTASGHLTYQYDQVGNLRKSADEGDKSFGYIYDALDRLIHNITAHPNLEDIDLTMAPAALASAGYTVSTIAWDIASQKRQNTQHLASGDRVSDYEYDDQGRLKRTLGPAVTGGRAEMVYHYDAVGKVVSEDLRIDATKFVTTNYVFDNLDRLVQQIDPKPLPGEATSATNDVVTTSFFYDVASRSVKTIDTLGRQWDYDYDDLDRLIKTTSPLLTGEATRALSETDYNLVGSVTRYTDKLGRQFDYTLDVLYGVTQVEGPSTEHVDPTTGNTFTARATTQTSYDVLRRVSDTTDELGRTTLNTFDNLDRLTKRTLPDPDGAGPLSAPEWIYSYDIAGNHVRTVDPEGNVSTNRYDNRHWLAASIEPFAEDSPSIDDQIIDDGDSGFAVVGTWNTVTASGGYGDDYRTIGAGTGTNTATWTFTLADPGKQYEIFVTWQEIAGAATDAKFTVGDGAASEGTFEIDQSVAPRKEFNDATTNWQSLGIFRLSDGTLTVTVSDDADGTVIADAVRIVERAPVSHTVYNEVGELVSQSDALDRTTTREYDAMGRVAKVVYPDPDGAGPETSPIMLYDYDLYSRVLKETYILGVDDNDPGRPGGDPDDLVTEYEYDDLHRVILERDGNGDETLYTYDLVDNLLSKTDAEGNVTSYEYDEWNRLTKETITVDSQALTREYSYDHENNLTLKKDRNDHYFAYQYDNSDRVTEERWFESDPGSDPFGSPAVSPTNTIVTQYDIRDRVYSQRDDFSAYTYQYDELDRLVSVANFIDNNGDGDSDDPGDYTTPEVADVVLDYEYDADNRLTETAATIDGYADFINNYEYNGRDYLTQVTQQGSGSLAVAYKRVELQFDAEDQLDQILRYASAGTGQLVASSDFTYDDSSRLTGITHAKGANTLADFGWEYDESNRVTRFTSSVDGDVDYTYDQRSQLTGADYTGYEGFQSDEAYAYDANGNRTDVTYTVDIEQGLLAHWDFEEGSGTTATDEINSLVANFDDGGTAHDPWTTGGAAGTGTSFEFDGDDALTVDTNYAQLNLGGNDLSLSLWVKPDASTGDTQMLMQLMDLASWGDGYYLTYDPAGSALAFYATDSTSGSGYTWVNVPDLTTAWHHVAVSYQQDGDIVLYLDGLPLDLHEHTESEGIDPDMPLWMGNSGDSYYGGYEGLMDEVRIYERAITGAEALALANENLQVVDDFDVATGDHNRITSDGTYDYVFDDQGNRISRTNRLNGEVDTYEWDVKNRLVKVTTTDNLERVHIDKDASSNAVVDQAGNLIPGVLVDDANWDNTDLPPTTGVNWAVATDGSGDMVQLGNQEAFTTTTGELSAALWFKPDTIGYPMLIQAGNTWDGGYTLRYAKNWSTQQWEITFSIGNGIGQTATVTAVLGSPLSGWHHAAFTFEHGGTTTIYLDGAAIKSQYTWVEGTIAPQGTVTLGQNLNGKLADFRLYHRALTSAEITTIKGNVAPIAGTIQEVEYTYDMRNRRIGKIVDRSGDGDVDVTERYVWDVAAMDGKGNVVLDFVDEYDGVADWWDLKRRYLWGQSVDQLLAQENFDWSGSAESVLWALTDNLGSVRDVVKYDSATDTTSVEEHYTYSSFGEITSGDPSVIRYTYTAQEYDPHTGLFYYDQRWYDATTGQFISPDPIEDDRTNDYRYVNNSPINATDPSGLADIVDGPGDIKVLPSGRWEGSREAIQRYKDGDINYSRFGRRSESKEKPAPPFPQEGEDPKTHNYVPRPIPEMERVGEDWKGREHHVGEEKNIELSGEKVDDTLRTEGPDAGTGKFYAPLKEGDIVTSAGTGPCVGVTIVTPKDGAAVYHFSPGADPRLEIGKWKWPDGSKAAINGGGKGAQSRRTYDWAIEALKDPDNNIKFEGVADYEDLFYEKLPDGKERWAIAENTRKAFW